LAIAIYRSKRQYFIELKSIPLKVKNINLFSNENENLFLNNLISSLDATNMTLQQDSVLNNLIANFIDNVQSQIITHIKDDPKVFQEVYDYIYKCIIRNNYDFYFYDNKLDDLIKHYEKLYRILSVSLIDIEKHYNIIFSYFQIATLTLIIRKFTMQHKVIGRNSKNIVIVTNSSVEKINFFIETMKFYVDIASITIININEIHLLENLKYDCILTFSNRIQTLLKENNYTSTKLNFYITKEDIETLFSLGFSTSRRKIKITTFINKIRNKNEEEIKNILLNDYNNYFV
jgi:transcriptional antiterminator